MKKLFLPLAIILFAVSAILSLFGGAIVLGEANLEAALIAAGLGFFAASFWSDKV